MKKKPFNYRGFTFIELMVVITIMIILSGIALAGYFQFSQRQAALNDVRNFVTSLRRVQAMAKNLVYPNGCVGLQSYQLTATEGETNVSASAICSNTIPVIINEKVLEKTTFQKNGVNISFDAGTGNIRGPVKTYKFYTSSYSSFVVTVTADPSGNISVTQSSSGGSAAQRI